MLQSVLAGRLRNGLSLVTHRHWTWTAVGDPGGQSTRCSISSPNLLEPAGSETITWKGAVTLVSAHWVECRSYGKMLRWWKDRLLLVRSPLVYLAF
jgi:hypothetical protein